MCSKGTPNETGDLTLCQSTRHLLDELTGTSRINTVYEIEIPSGTTIYKGPAGNQGEIYLGGLDTIQIYIKEPWNIEGVKVIDSSPLK